MTFTLTDGEWSVHPLDKRFLVANYGETEGAAIYDPIADFKTGGDPRIDQDNARLCSAAKELFAACVELATAKNEPTEELARFRIRSAERMAVSAIAKVRGN